jgi:hypothetical protein
MSEIDEKKLSELGFNGNRLSENPQEEKTLNTFYKQFDDRGCHNQMDLIIFGNKAGRGTTTPRDYLTEREKKIVYSTIQWLGSPVGKHFLRDCGYELKIENK